MNISIENIAKIHSATIKCDGITLIVGDNNTGKSSIGEIVCSFFLSLKNRRQKNINSRVVSVLTGIRSMIWKTPYADSNTGQAVQLRHKLFELSSSKDIKNKIEVFFDSGRTDVIALVDEIIGKDEILNSPEIRNSLIELINNTINISDEELTQDDVLRTFNNVFHSRINTLYNNENGLVQVSIQGQKNILEFKKDSILTLTHPTEIQNSVFYIRNPFDLDGINSSLSDNILVRDLQKKLSKTEHKDQSDENSIERITRRKMLAEVVSKISDVIPGNIAQTNNGFSYIDGNFNIYLESLSTGLKSFAVIKQLIVNGQLKEKDIIVFDEPEIHLHPEWQLIYAELIVLLQKTLNLTVLITTHSTTFIEAIELFVQKHELEPHRCNYYLAQDSSVKDMTDFKDITGNLEFIYGQYLKPIKKLISLRDSLENLKDE